MPFWILWLKWCIIGGLNVSNFIQKITNHQGLLLTNISSYLVFQYMYLYTTCIFFGLVILFWLYFAWECPFYSCKLFLYGSVIHVHIQILDFYRLYCSHATWKAGCCLHDICCLLFIGIFCCVWIWIHLWCARSTVGHVCICLWKSTALLDSRIAA